MLAGSGKADLPAALFGEPFHESLVHEAVKADLAARRRGTASSLTRGEVSMTGAKAWRQKGTGRARVGALSVPHRYGGGTAFGPKPRHYILKVNRKARRRALRAALSVHAARESVAAFDGSTFDTPSTKKASEGLAKWDAKLPVLVLIGPEEAGAAKSFRNIERVQVLEATEAGVADVIGAASLVISKEALASLEERSGDVDKSPKPKAAKEKPSAASSGASASPAKASQPAGPGSEAEEPAVEAAPEKPAPAKEEAEEAAKAEEAVEEVKAEEAPEAEEATKAEEALEEGEGA
jgi:large subunit ribosomal protein L4